MLTDNQLRAIRDVRLAFPSEPLVLIGAAALMVHFDNAFVRRTNDVDLTLLCADLDTHTVASRLTAFAQDKSIPHRFRHIDTDVYIDLLAVGPTALERGAVTFSQTGTIMNLTGFDLALQSLLSVDFGATPLAELAQPITRAPAPVVVLLKMGAFLDRPERELADRFIATILGPDQWHLSSMARHITGSGQEGAVEKAQDLLEAFQTALHSNTDEK